MTLNEHCTVTLPHYKLSNELQKESLYYYCMENESIRSYLPDHLTIDLANRDLLISVRVSF